MSYADLVAKVEDAIWTELEDQIDMGFICRDRAVIDTGMADDLDMAAVAKAAVAAVADHLRLVDYARPW